MLISVRITQLNMLCCNNELFKQLLDTRILIFPQLLLNSYRISWWRGISIGASWHAADNHPSNVEICHAVGFMSRTNSRYIVICMFTACWATHVFDSTRTWTYLHETGKRVDKARCQLFQSTKFYVKTCYIFIYLCKYGN